MGSFNFSAWQRAVAMLVVLMVSGGVHCFIDSTYVAYSTPAALRKPPLDTWKLLEVERVGLG
jgi:hypothetical protein